MSPPAKRLRPDSAPNPPQIKSEEQDEEGGQDGVRLQTENYQLKNQLNRLASEVESLKHLLHTNNPQQTD
jgi:hypothetical protein